MFAIHIKARRMFKRYSLEIIFFTLVLVLGFSVGKAFASEPQDTKFLNQKPEQYIVARPAITTTTTTTTKPQTKMAVSSETRNPTQTASTPNIPQTGWVEQCNIWASMAGLELPPSAIILLDRESDCNPTVKNPHSSAGGIAQALPWTKMGCPLDWTDEAAVCQLKWMHGYVMARYSSWESALAHSNQKGWY